MAEDRRHLLHFKTLTKFLEKLNDGTINKDRHIAFIKDEGLLWCRDVFYSDAKKLLGIVNLYNGWTLTQNAETCVISLRGQLWNETTRTWDSRGSTFVLPAATQTNAGLLSATDKTKLDNITGVNYTIDGAEDSESYTIKLQGVNASDNSEITDLITIPAATQTNAGLLSATDKTKLDIFNAETVNGYKLSVGTSAGSDANTIYFVI